MFSFGLKVGAPLTDLMHAGTSAYLTDTRRYTLGPTVELHLPFGLGAEADLLYKRMGYGSSGTGGVTATANRWEVPLLVKYRFPGWPLRPFMDGGVSFNRVMGAGGAAKNLADLQHPSAKGFVLGGGLEARLGLCRLAPELRLTRWGNQNYGPANALLHSNLTQLDFLVGLTF